MRRSSERGNANLKFLIVMAMLGSIAYAGYLYVPVAYQAKAYTDLMQHYADLGSASGHPAAWVTDQLTKSAPEFDVPPNAVITAALKDSRMEVRVQFVREIEFPGYTYNYEVDHTAKSTAFLAFK